MKESSPVVEFPFSAVLLAGGRSTRMGFDKATLVVNGEPLWRRQIKILQSLGSTAVLVSGPVDGPWQGSGLAVVEDDRPHLGPMGALVSILQTITTDLVLILAVDMPAMTTDFLRLLLAKRCPIVPQNGDYFEPLAAIYSRAELPALQRQLENDRRSLQVHLCETTTLGKTQIHFLTTEEKELFLNLNELMAEVRKADS